MRIIAFVLQVKQEADEVICIKAEPEDDQALTVTLLDCQIQQPCLSESQVHLVSKSKAELHLLFSMGIHSKIYIVVFLVSIFGGCWFWCCFVIKTLRLLSINQVKITFTPGGFGHNVHEWLFRIRMDGYWINQLLLFNGITLFMKLMWCRNYPGGGL